MNNNQFLFAAVLAFVALSINAQTDVSTVPVASWPTQSWPVSVASWPTQSWPVDSWPTQSWPESSC